MLNLEELDSTKGALNLLLSERDQAPNIVQILKSPRTASATLGNQACIQIYLLGGPEAGVGLVTLAGGQRPAVRVKLNAQAIAALGLTSEDIRTAITSANVNSAKGSLDGPARAVTLSANDQMQSAQEYRQLIVAYKKRRANSPWRRSDH